MSRIFSNIKKSRTKKSREERKNGDEKGKVEKEDTDGPSGRSYAYHDMVEINISPQH